MKWSNIKLLNFEAMKRLIWSKFEFSSDVTINIHVYVHVHVYFRIHFPVRGRRDMDMNRDKNRGRDMESDMDTDGDTDRNRDWDTDKDRDWGTDTDTEKDRDRHFRWRGIVSSSPRYYVEATICLQNGIFRRLSDIFASQCQVLKRLSNSSGSQAQNSGVSIIRQCQMIGSRSEDSFVRPSSTLIETGPVTLSASFSYVLLVLDTKSRGQPACQEEQKKWRNEDVSVMYECDVKYECMYECDV